MRLSKTESEGCGYAVAVLVLWPFASAWRGFTLAKLWSWFISDTFGLPQLTVPQAIGLSLIVSAFTYQVTDCVENERTPLERFSRTLSMAFIGPLLMLGFGWIVKLFL